MTERSERRTRKTTRREAGPTQASSVSASAPEAQGAQAPREEPAAGTQRYRTRHLRVGWWMLLCFLSLGIALESMHGFKIGWYLDVSNETRRLMWRLAHAHGTLLGLVNIAFAATVSLVRVDSRMWRVPSSCLLVGGMLLPAGFFLGGLVVYGGDPGLGVLLVPAGAVLLLLGVALAVRAVRAGA